MYIIPHESLPKLRWFCLIYVCGGVTGGFFEHSQFCDQSRGSNIKINTQMVISGFFLNYPCILIILIVNIFFDFSPNTFDSLVVQAAWKKNKQNIHYEYPF